MIALMKRILSVSGPYQGRIVQAGDHDKLMAEEGIYRRFITARSNPTGWCR